MRWVINLQRCKEPSTKERERKRKRRGEKREEKERERDMRRVRLLGSASCAESKKKHSLQTAATTATARQPAARKITSKQIRSVTAPATAFRPRRAKSTAILNACNFKCSLPCTLQANILPGDLVAKALAGHNGKLLDKLRKIREPQAAEENVSRGQEDTGKPTLSRAAEPGDFRAGSPPSPAQCFAAHNSSTCWLSLSLSP